MIPGPLTYRVFRETGPSIKITKSNERLIFRKTKDCPVLLDQRCYSFMPGCFLRRQKYNGLKLPCYEPFFTLSLNAVRSEKQKMERTYTANLTSKQQQLDDCSRRSVQR